MFKNYMEVIVNNLLEAILIRYPDICKCPKCKDDIQAIALNNLKPLYVVTNTGTIYAKFNELQFQFRADVTRELIQAVEKVSVNTRHNSYD